MTPGQSGLKAKVLPITNEAVGNGKRKIEKKEPSSTLRPMQYALRDTLKELETP
jgi:hypothetical protein